MREFFHGWRRKAGIVTLVMACALAGLWLVTYGKSSYGVATLESTIWVFDATNGNVKFLRYDKGEAVSMFDHRASISLEPSNCCHLRIGVGEIGVYEKVHYGTENIIWGLGREKDWRVIPVWAMPVPLTVLSAYLIFWKPRKRE